MGNLHLDEIIKVLPTKLACHLWRILPIGQGVTLPASGHLCRWRTASYCQSPIKLKFQRFGQRINLAWIQHQYQCSIKMDQTAPTTIVSAVEHISHAPNHWLSNARYPHYSKPVPGLGSSTHHSNHIQRKVSTCASELFSVILNGFSEGLCGIDLVLETTKKFENRD